MSSIQQTANAPAFLPAAVGIPSRAYRFVIGTAILCGLMGVLVVTFNGALFDGLRDALARGAVLVTIDSDSVIEPDTLLAMAGPFRNPRVGAVAGKVAALNRDNGWLPRMLHVRYIVSFKARRSAQTRGAATQPA